MSFTGSWNGSNPSIVKDPTDNLDYTVDWHLYLADVMDTIASVAWSVSPAGLTLGTNSKGLTDATTWLSGGVAGTTYMVTCQITTAGTPTPRVTERTFAVICQNR
jgi:hypothetical protein